MFKLVNTKNLKFGTIGIHVISQSVPNCSKNR